MTRRDDPKLSALRDDIRRTVERPDRKTNKTKRKFRAIPIPAETPTVFSGLRYIAGRATISTFQKRWTTIPIKNG